MKLLTLVLAISSCIPSLIGADSNGMAYMAPSLLGGPMGTVETVEQKETVHFLSRGGFSKETFSENDSSDRVQIHHSLSLKISPGISALTQLNTTRRSVELNFLDPPPITPPAGGSFDTPHVDDDDHAQVTVSSSNLQDMAIEPTVPTLISIQLNKAVCYVIQLLFIVIAPLQNAIAAMVLNLSAYFVPELDFLASTYVCLPILSVITLFVWLGREVDDTCLGYKDDGYDIV